MRNRRISDVYDAVEALLPELRTRARATEDERQVSTEVMRDLTGTGLFTVLQPHRYGGLEADPVDFFAVVRRVASACGSTGWVSSVLGVHPWHLALFDGRAQQDVWGEDPDTLLSSAYAPMGRAVASDGGYFFSGRWSYSSGIAHAGWVLVGGFVVDDAGDPIDFRTFLIPARDYRVDDVWDTVGLRGTGSNDVVVEDAFVPEYRTLSFAATVQCRCPGQDVNPSALYRLPFSAVFSTAIATPIVGMADGAYTAFVEQQTARRESSNTLRVPDDPFMHAALAESARDIEIAWTQLRGNLDALLESARAQERIPLSLRIKTRRDQVGASGSAVAAIDRLFDFAGGAALRSSAPLQRFWRDAHAGRAHVINDPHQALTLSGRSELGHDIRDAWV
ncbi:3-hydroxy-9,10-secoandrosta-1,3,5(10)-triene-9,17-dione monooxygenase oxygenase subunit [Prescottella subtropica]|uniref:3-hydroxy-9,10-secoandrosta-1,3,5(10)-triene-9, 17-dione monooxygenase oxygenase subunit n=1 Tax=Prescottella subtropica TaxID=2545757 RepID=UPI0010F4B536|nr:3-hydroxy-9,10-secoandrosta-1,3,5(10)-triene-9,17-dione monooxygenase oxygenase subunit [Prescottella subtropica]